MHLIFDKPRSQGVENAIARARQQCTLEWKPMRECISNDDGSWGYLIPARSGRAQVLPSSYFGIPYSSSRVLDKMVGLDISFSTFLSATDNPASIVYTRDLSDDTDLAYNPRISNAYFIYGTVCSSLACYAMDLPIHYSTREWDAIPELYEVAKESVDDIALADTLVTFNKSVGHTGGHVAVITSIARDEKGHVQRVEITEGWEPTQRYRWDSRKTFEARMLRNGGSYLVFRHRDIDSIAPPLPIERATTDLMLDLGAFSNYREGEPIHFNIAADTEALLIESESGASMRIDAAQFVTKEIDGVKYTMYIAEGLAPARYEAYLLKGEQRSASVRFAVVRAPQPKITRADGSELSRVAFIPVATDGTPLTKNSPCLYKKDTDILLRCAPFALSHNGKLYTAYGALREENGKLMLYPAVPMTDGEGNAVSSFEVGAPVTLYLLAAEEGDCLTVTFDGAKATEPYSFCPKEEAAVTFDQRLITEQESAAASISWSAIPSLYNRFVGLSVVYKNEYGKITSVPSHFIVL